MSGADQKVNENDAGPTFHVTILRTKSTGRIIYLEAGKDLVDVLLTFLVLPVGTIITMLNAEGVKERKFGAMDNIYKSVEKLQDSMLYVKKTLLTQPRPDRSAFGGSVVLKLAPPSELHYSCSKCKSWMGEDKFFCPSCKIITYMDKQSINIFPPYPKAGYSKESVSYMVCNSLEIMPTSTTNTMDVFSKMKVTNFSDMLSINGEIRRKDVLKMLLAAISGSETPLSDVLGADSIIFRNSED